MKRKFLIIVFILLCINKINSQQIVQDENTSIPIPFVEIYADNGDLIGLTDGSGFISNELNKKVFLSKSKSLTFFHFSYDKKIIFIENFQSSIVFSLNPSLKILNEVVISNNFTNKYLKLKGYFRSSQINEDNIQYFMDGIVEYYIEKGSDKIKMKIISYRTFENKNIKQLSKRFYFLVAGIPIFNDFCILDNVYRAYKLNTINSQSTVIKNKNNDQDVGLISTSGNLTTMQLQIISKENPKIMKFLGMESRLLNYNISSAFNITSKEGFNFKNIIYFKEIREYEIRRKKKDDFVKVDAIHEFFLLEKSYSNELENRNFDDFYSFKTNSSYNSDYWLNIKNTIYQPVPISIEKYISENLVENKNIFQKKQ